ncbi:hypothetical protein DH09_19245 [Bacillaceae bacterium JMAK1]|nr:hypothetical protein DH09_19245 [Bacillaceae bacterium JMAK1]
MHEYVEKFTEYVLAGDDDQASRLVDSAVAQYTKTEVFEQLITPAMYKVGALWEENKISVADEHLATAVVDMIITSLDQKEPQEEALPEMGKVLIGGVEAEEHYLGLKMVSSRFRDYRWNVRYLGPNLPLSHLHTMAQMWKPDVIVLSVALAYRLPSVTEYVDAFSKFEHQPTILIGGRVAPKLQSTFLEYNNVFVLEGLDALDQWIETGKVGSVHAGTK